jgi:hypothetical protein
MCVFVVSSDILAFFKGRSEACISSEAQPPGSLNTYQLSNHVFLLEHGMDYILYSAA